MILNFHFSSIELNFPSLTQIPNNEEYIQLLFDCLEISAIIKLWCSVLCEKHIIFISNQGYLLFAITQGLLSLIFPFSWLYTYIPILPVNLIDYLDSPIPYIIGILANTIDINELNEKYPGHVICDLNSSTINKNGVSFLSNIEIAPRLGLVIDTNISFFLTIFFARLGASFNGTGSISFILPVIVSIELISIYGNVSIKKAF